MIKYILVINMNIKTISLNDYCSSVDGFYLERIEAFCGEEKLHTHDCFQIIYCKQGNITHYLGDISARMLRGDVCIVAPGMKHKILPTEKNTIYYNISFSKSYLQEKFSGASLAAEFMDSLEKSEILIPKLSPLYDDIYLFDSSIGKMRILFDGERCEHDEIIAIYLLGIVSVISRMYNRIETGLMSENDKKLKRINHCIFYIDSHFDEPIPLEKIVKMSALSKSTFCVLFKEVTGMTFNDYLNKKRIERIKTILRFRSDVASAAYGNGYTELSTFYRNFVKFTGMTPGEFKKRENAKDKD